MGILLWLWLRQRSNGGQAVPFPKSGVLLTLGAAFVWLWLGLCLAVPRMIREGRLGHPDLGEVMQTIFDFGTVGTIPVLMNAPARPVRADIRIASTRVQVAVCMAIIRVDGRAAAVDVTSGCFPCAADASGR